MPIHHDMLGNLPTDTDRTFVALADATVGASQFSVHENVLDPGAVVPWHAHAVQEVIVCLSGTGECTLEGERAEHYRAGSVLVIPADTLHTLRNVGDGRLSQIAILGGSEPGTRWVESEGSVDRSRTRR
jgi:quercetin dioxygenase-like cupin family protein